MKNQISYSTLGNTFIHRMRNEINNSEDAVDLENCFSLTSTDFLREVFGEIEIEINSDDIVFDSQKKDYYTISKTLSGQEKFKEIWQNSDLPSVIKKFAESTYHHYLHLQKHPEKTQKKIRN
ncbi:MAG: hypothetical protein JXB60_03525 [Candidatus Cloacimonetes bacterium]|nr:hypothetical protein [Candidatus Cloacimonadota bacterium]